MKKNGHQLKAPLALLGLVLSIVVIPMSAAHADPWTIVGKTDVGSRYIVMDQAGNLYTSNFQSNTVSKITPAGVSTIFGSTGAGPYGIAIDSSGNIYTSNLGDGTITKIPQVGDPSVYATIGAGSQPYALVFDQAGNLYTANYGANYVNSTWGNVSKIFPPATISDRPRVIVDYTDPGTSKGARGIAIDSAGNLYTSNNFDHTVTKITPSGDKGSPTPFGVTDGGPFGILVDSFGNVFTSNQGANTVSKITPTGTGSKTDWGRTGSGPRGIAIDPSGNIYTTNWGSQNISKITSEGVSTILGSAGYYSFAAFYASGNIYTTNLSIAENSSFISKISLTSATSTAVSTIADGTYNCRTGLPSTDAPTFTITRGVVSGGATCAAGLVTIPRGATSIGAKAFGSNGVDQSEFSQLTSVIIPDTVTSIDDYAFSGDQGLTSITIPNSVIHIGIRAFGNTNLTSLKIPGSVKSLDAGAFQSIRTLTSVEIENGLPTITRNSFLNDDALVSVVIPNSVTAIDDTAFSGTGLTSLTIPNGVRYIGQESFANTKLNSLAIPNGVLAIQKDAFASITSLSTFEYCEVALTADALNAAGLKGKTKTCTSAASVSAGSVPNSKVAAIPQGVTSAAIAASAALPATTINFGGTVPASVTVSPLASNPAAASATPFAISGTKIVDIQIPGTLVGTATVCLDGTSTDHLYHYTGTPAAWVELGSRSYANGQVCGVTTSFSPFAAAAPALVAAPTPAPVPDPVQQSKITALSVSTAIAGT
jgi:DNA-binding beta-propeller fold protein YncE